MNKEQPVLPPYTVGALKLPNRVVMAPMTNRIPACRILYATCYHGTYHYRRHQVSSRAVGNIHTPGTYSEWLSHGTCRNVTNRDTLQ
ncbi:hypothetical protein [Altibacter sp.]|uniref:hypothetical protein n=1 Tax=Altibacter sp. TaxID=2024823 RepID=UPI002585B7AF|nr:hypothetical protein [Altibacter sp.]MCW9036835.1 hypothetical protein [Altibacter sp.]